MIWRRLSSACVAAVVIVGVPTRLDGQDEWWRPLMYRTAWVLLGDVDRAANRWATNPHHRVVKPIARDSSSVIPNIGDIVEFTRDDVQVGILDYKNKVRGTSMCHRRPT